GFERCFSPSTIAPINASKTAKATDSARLNTTISNESINEQTPAYRQCSSDSISIPRCHGSTNWLGCSAGAEPMHAFVKGWRKKAGCVALIFAFAIGLVWLDSHLAVR